MSYKVTIKPSNHVLWMEAGEAILDAALREGYNLPYGCRNGTCGTCMGKVLAGQVVYPDAIPSGISARQQAEGKALFCQARPCGDLIIEAREIDALRDIAIKTLPCRVVGMHKLAPDVMRLYLKLPASERLQFLAGQYISLLLRDGRRRDFSLANAPHADEYLEIHVRKVPNGEFTQFVFEKMREKSILRFQGPLGSFFPTRRLSTPHHYDRRRHRFCTSQGHPGTRLPRRHYSARSSVLGSSFAARPLPQRATRGLGRTTRPFSLYAGALGT